MATVVLAIGAVFAAEGLVLALAPSRIEAALEFLRAMPPDMLRLIGLVALAAGTALIWLARGLGG